jgi:enoyl-CoA hydratase
MIVREDVGATAVVRLAHGKVSALDLEFCEALTREVQTIATSTSTSLLLTGTGSTFSAGVDLFRVLDGGVSYLDRFLPAMKTLFETVLTFPKPAVAAVNGHAIAGGCILAAACDHRIMARGTGRIGVPELAVGVPFPALPFVIVGARVPATMFRQIVYSGRLASADEAVTMGLADEAIDPVDLHSRARAHAEALARIPAITFALTKRTFVSPLLERVRAESALNAEAQKAWATPEVQSRVRTYLEATVRKGGSGR